MTNDNNKENNNIKENDTNNNNNSNNNNSNNTNNSNENISNEEPKISGIVYISHNRKNFRVGICENPDFVQFIKATSDKTEEKEETKEIDKTKIISNITLIEEKFSKLKLESPDDFICKKDNTLYNILQTATYENNTSLMRYLLKIGAQVDFKTYPLSKSRSNLNLPRGEEKTSLHIAAEMGNAPACKILMRAGANSKEENNRGQTPLHIVAYEYNRICRILTDPENKISDEQITFYTEAKKKYAAICKMLVNYNAVKDETETALHIAVRMKDNKACAILISTGFDYNAVNSQGQTPLSIAKSTGQTIICNILLQTEASQSAKNQNEKTTKDITISKAKHIIKKTEKKIIKTYSKESGKKDSRLISDERHRSNSTPTPNDQVSIEAKQEAESSDVRSKKPSFISVELSNLKTRFGMLFRRTPSPSAPPPPSPPEEPKNKVDIFGKK